MNAEQMNQTQRLPLLLEIGTEEIPARFLSPAVQSLKENASALLHEHYIDFSEIKTYATPRRIVLIVTGLPDQQASRVREIFGPPKRIAFDEGGNPTEAAVKFANSQGVKAENLVVKKKDKGEYVVAVVEEKDWLSKTFCRKCSKRLFFRYASQKP